MNPRHRRLVIPAALVVLLLIVVVAGVGDQVPVVASSTEPTVSSPVTVGRGAVVNGGAASAKT